DPPPIVTSTLSLHDALPIFPTSSAGQVRHRLQRVEVHSGAINVSFRSASCVGATFPWNNSSTSCRRFSSSFCSTRGKARRVPLEIGRAHVELQSRGHLVCRL